MILHIFLLYLGLLFTSITKLINLKGMFVVVVVLRLRTPLLENLFFDRQLENLDILITTKIDNTHTSLKIWLGHHIFLNRK